MVGQLRPDQQAHFIRRGVIARVGDFDVDPQAVESHLFGFAEFVFDVFLRGRRSRSTQGNNPDRAQQRI